MHVEARQAAATAGFIARARRAAFVEYARAEARGDRPTVDALVARFAGQARSELRREGSTLRRRYNAQVEDWLIGRAASRRTVREELRRTEPKRRLRAVRMSVFYAMGDHLVRTGLQTESRVGHVVNRMLTGEDEAPASLRPLLRFYRRTRGLCPGCGGNDARDSGSVCDECGL